jgi:MHS family proline/betaine transporter-like MFS transporter
MFNKHVFYCISGTVLEWYDFSLFASLISILSKVFFPPENGGTHYLPFFFFACGFLMRPFGGIFFGHLGDKLGRKSTLMFTYVLMALSTTGVGILPGHGGILWLWILLLLRMIQGFAASGEYAGSVILLYELPGANSKSARCSLGLFASAIGILLGIIVCTIIISLLKDEQMLAWGWRIPFLLGLPLSILGFVLRKNLLESKGFSQAKEAQTLVKLPLWDALKHHYKSMLLITAMYMLGNVSFYINFVYLTSYTVAQHQLSFIASFYLNCLITIVYAMCIPIFGYLSDFITGKKLMQFACVLMLILILPLFKLILSGDLFYQFFGQILLAALLGVFSGPISLIATELLPLNIRYSGLAVSLNIGAAFFGGTTPLISSWLTHYTQHAISPAYYWMLITLVTLLAVTYLPATAKPKSFLRMKMFNFERVEL